MSTPDSTLRTTAQPARRSPVSVLAVPAGGCGACAQSLEALHAPQYAAELGAKGISFVRSPRHADIVLLTGPVTSDSIESLRQYIAGVPQPHALVAVGDCAVDGGVFKGSPDIVPSAAEALDVHVEITGCPPAPSAILAAIVEAAELLASADATDEGELDDEEEDTEESLADDDMQDLDEEAVTDDEGVDEEAEK